MTQKKARHQLPRRLRQRGHLRPGVGAGEKRKWSREDPEGLLLSCLKDLALDERTKGEGLVSMT